MEREYNHWIVALSYVIAVVASYVALDMASRVSASRGTKVANYWLIGGALAMGAGIWSMHFVGMLAFTLPIPIPYSISITFLSLVFAIAASGTALHAISHGSMDRRKLLTAGTVMGCGVALMHYTGMFALQITPRPSYHAGLFCLSVLIAILASIAALWVCFQLKSDTIATAFWKKSASALVMGIAIWGMHFTGMSAAIFDANSICSGTAQTIDSRWLATTVSLCTFFFLAATMLISLVDAKMSEHRTTLEAQSERFFNQSLNIICLCGPDGRFLRLNPAGWATLGYSREKLLANPFIEIIHAEDRPAIDTAMRTPDWGKAALSVEGRCVCADGSSKSLLWTITRSEDTGGFYATGHNITERKLAEQELAKTYQRLLEVSRAAGMAEIATGVLHNVGNVLNSVNVSANLAVEHLQQSKLDGLEKICALLEMHKANLGEFITTNPRGKLVAEYLRSLSESLRGEQTSVISELQNLQKNIQHIKDIVAMQQNYAKNSGFSETVSLPELIEDALRINTDSLAQHDIELIRDYRIKPVAVLDKHKVMQILINLVRNAKLACNDSGKTEKSITVRTSGDKSVIRIEVIDNGIGIPRENLIRIFGHGFTTRKDGHGFGLHSGALAAREMDGSLTVTSAGLGQGATFILELPYKPGTDLAAHAAA